MYMYVLMYERQLRRLMNGKQITNSICLLNLFKYMIVLAINNNLVKKNAYILALKF